jgi:hypothetical protein
MPEFCSWLKQQSLFKAEVCNNNYVNHLMEKQNEEEQPNPPSEPEADARRPL